ncbi:beta-1,4-mannosyl-glycoprotein 4-beta-N-acetylglucosaminyltransferase a isoform X2 [Esox lucius]|uniref:Beta-1,4-mannosyl-glycoprotein 4-beta-N-acetylglucosaminyltransferase a n=1 Tax=Esox lucius TaxID=8010 RepID=A0A3P8ZUY5_ESOLU|nr:beta-1,4-mannosyl-glycoprotein 4-beta-N-acetylglucosaminyltransferase a isoform X2 [Esox lucius]
MQNRTKMRRLKVFVLCLMAFCILLLRHHYQVLYNRLGVRDLQAASAKFKALRYFWTLTTSTNLSEPRGYQHNQNGRWTGHGNEDQRGDEPAAPTDQDTVTFTLPDPTGPSGELHKRSFLLRDDATQFFVRTKSGATCFREGTDMAFLKVGERVQQTGVGWHKILHFPQEEMKRDQGQSSLGKSLANCTCRPGWHGPHCGIPTMIQHSNLPSKWRLMPRKVPRRVINAININHEFDLLHARFHELADAVDVFLVCESNFTAYGSPKPLHFLHFLLNGTYNYMRHKILYIFLDHFPKGGQQNGWIADDYLRTFLSYDGMSRVKGVRPDDVFLINDADEIPAREGILFLKLYDGWTEPVSIHMRKSLYGFFWKQPGTLDILSACTVAMLFSVYNRDGISLRRREYFTMPGFRAYEKKNGQILLKWSIGSPIHYAGWHCSWCFSPEGIYYKLISAQNGDFPRWGDYAEKRDLNYIKNLIRTGGWFDGSVGQYPHTEHKEHMYAPKYMLNNPQRYKYMLENPYAKKH